jgi:DNA mismatch endonuclease, patch repair protein
MSRVKSRDNKTTEMALVGSLRKYGIKGWRRHLTLRFGGFKIKPDLVFVRHGLAVFLNGCFWHRCPKHGTSPSSNAEFWKRKLDANLARDKRNNRLLKSEGWKVLCIWEHEIKSDPDFCVVKILRSLIQ